MTISTGVFKQLVAKKQSALGTKATAASAQIYRRVTSTIDLSKETYKSNEIRPSMQRADFRHGVRSVSGSINGELSVGTYSEFMASTLRSAWAATSAYAAGIDVTAAATSPHFVDASGGYLTAGLKVGMVGRWTGFAGGGATANNSRNFLITALTATDMSGVFLDGTAVVADAAGDSVTFTPVGKSVYIPTTSHTRDYWTIEHNYADIVQSEQFTDCVFGTMNVQLPATGMATIDFPVIGLDMDTSTAAYFTSPTAVSSGNILAAVNGAVYVAGVAVGYITGMDISVNGNVTSVGGVVGSNVAPDITPGSFDVTGNMTVLFQDATMRDYFKDETEVSVVAAFTSANTATADVMVFSMPRVKVGGASKDDGEKGLIMTMPFTALENTAGGTGTSTVASTIVIQDSSVA
jgi:hypothetical protein